MSNFLQEGYTPPKSNSNYMRFEEGENRFRVMSSAIVGYEYWTNDNKPVRSKTPFETTPNAKVDKSGKVSIKHFWAFVVWAVAEKKIMILEVTQSSIQNAIFSFVKNADWGDPKQYDIIVNRTGVELDTKYNVVPCPHKETPQEALEFSKGMTINLEALYSGGDPFATSIEEAVNNIPM